MLHGTRTACRLAAIPLAVAILYGLTVSPLFVYCVGVSGHREIEITTCAGCVHPSDPGHADPAGPPSFGTESHPAENCGDCVDFSLTLAATEKSDRASSSGMPFTPSTFPCPPAGLAAPRHLASAADLPCILEPALPASARPLPLKI